MITFRHNAMTVSSLNAFENIKGGFSNNRRDVYFVRAVGFCPTLFTEIESADMRISGRVRQGYVYYNRIKELPKNLSPDTAGEYSRIYDKWQSTGKRTLSTRVQTTAEFGEVLSQAFVSTLEMFRKGKNGVSESIEKNFAVKMMWWLDNLFEGLLKQWSITASMKIVSENITKRQEYLFFYMLTLIGCDVLLLQCREDISVTEASLGLSTQFRLGDFSAEEIPPFKGVQAYSAKKEPSAVHTERAPQSVFSVSQPALRPSPVNIVRPSRDVPQRPSRPVQNSRPTALSQGIRTEKSFEELARLASSVVMIAVCDATGKVKATGSGIMIGREGYILTNSHVASGGRYYSVRIEDDENYYDTDEVIKYNTLLDLAIIRINRRLDPIPVYKGTQPLVRGQRVVAIGSPMGLFNSVSDGIISGFRTINNVDMIQFTAPTSHGSSGGAVLNMYGEVIGISTAGIDSGQNLNLAMGYECINDFIKGFITLK